ncbi:MAG: FIST C-terminal domain-containing protein [Alphaproteobacteria bacterium]|nr:FIST C-terminal domain-containing protein [Alphaproteobacteria bacterium]
MFKLAVAHTEDPDAHGASEELIHVLAAQLGGIDAQALMVLAPVDFEYAVLLEELRRAYPDAGLIGCTTDGELSGSLGFQEDSVVVMGFAAKGLTFRAGIGRGVSADPDAAAAEALAQAGVGMADPPRLCITLPDGLTSRGVDITEGLQAALGEGVTLFGGTAGDSFRFEKTLQFFGDEVLEDSLPVLLVYGDLRLACGVASGWRPVGEGGVVTRVEGGVVYEIDGAPTREFYRAVLGDHIPPSGEYPLAVPTGGEGKFYLRFPTGWDPKNGSVTYAADVPAGSRVHVTKADRDEILQGAAESLRLALEDYGAGTPDAAFFVSCCARKQVLGTRACEEHREILSVLPEGLPFAGFYSYGEISPIHAGEAARFHNETLITLLLGAP